MQARTWQGDRRRRSFRALGQSACPRLQQKGTFPIEPCEQKTHTPHPHVSKMGNIFQQGHYQETQTTQIRFGIDIIMQRCNHPCRMHALSANSSVSSMYDLRYGRRLLSLQKRTWKRSRAWKARWVCFMRWFTCASAALNLGRVSESCKLSKLIRLGAGTCRMHNRNAFRFHVPSRLDEHRSLFLCRHACEHDLMQKRTEGSWHGYLYYALIQYKATDEVCLDSVKPPEIYHVAPVILKPHQIHPGNTLGIQGCL